MKGWKKIAFFMCGWYAHAFTLDYLEHKRARKEIEKPLGWL